MFQIVDGNAKTDVSNRREPGQFCGEAEQPQTFISETSYVRVLFHTDNFTDQVNIFISIYHMSIIIIQRLWIITCLNIYSVKNVPISHNILIPLDCKFPSLLLKVYPLRLMLSNHGRLSRRVERSKFIIGVIFTYNPGHATKSPM